MWFILGFHLGTQQCRQIGLYRQVFMTPYGESEDDGKPCHAGGEEGEVLVFPLLLITLRGATSGS